MKGIKGLRFGMLGAAAIAVAVIGGLLIAGTAAAQGGATLTVSDGSAAPGEEGDVSLDAGSVGDPGLGAWTVDIAYDTSVITAVDCSAEQGGVCNAEFAADMVRITGASAGGLDGDTTLGGVTFECGADAGSSDLTLTVNVFADATIGDPQDIDPTIVNGTFECEAAAPDPTVVVDGPVVGTGLGADSGSSFGWLVALFAVVGTAGLVVGFGAQRSR